MLKDCKNPRSLDKLHRLPIKSESLDAPCDPEQFAISLEQVYSSTLPSLRPSRDLLKSVPRFQIEELQRTVKSMKRGRCPDKIGVMIEMIQAAPSTFLQELLDCFNRALDAAMVTEPS